MNIISPVNFFSPCKVSYQTSPVNLQCMQNLPIDKVAFSGNKKITGDIDFESKFSPKDMAIINLVTDYAAKSGVNVYIVGGSVRDILLGKDINDLDFLVEGDAVEFTKGLAEELDTACDTRYLKDDFGTAKIKLFDEEIDFASTREESYIKKGTPNVKNIGCSMKKDVKRRDFTINSIALKLAQDKSGRVKFQIIDEMNGINDLNDKKLRVTYKKSFEDDPTRIIRGLKFALRFGFTYDDETKKLQEEYLQNPPLEEISSARVDTTLRKLFDDKEIAPAAFKRLIDEKIYRLYTDKTIAKPEWGENLLKSADEFNLDDYKKLFMMALDDKKTKPLLEKFNKEEELSNYQIYKKFKKMSDYELALYYAITDDNNAVKFKNELKEIKPFINGEKLKMLGFQSGKNMGRILDELLKEKLNTGNLKTEDDELDFVQKIA